MKKTVLFLILSGISAICMAQAQSLPIASLLHNDSISTYYGYYGFLQAHDAAVDGDIITLSSGRFGGIDFNKDIVVRGAGIDKDLEAEIYPTIVETCYCNSKDSISVNVEGIIFEVINVFNLIEPTFKGCYIENIQPYQPYSDVGFPRLLGGSFYYCFIENIKWGGSGYWYSMDNTFVSCVLNLKSDNIYGSYINSSCHFFNCNLICSSTLYNSTFYNCVITGSLNLPTNSIAYNSIKVGGTDCFTSQDNNTNKYVDLPYESVFKTFKGTFSADDTYELTDSAASVFLGSDDTQVGIYGGAIPFSPTPSYPRITKFDVSDKTDSEGNLKVKIEVASGD